MTTSALAHQDRFSFLIDLFCRSGVNFEPLPRGMGTSGKIVAIDGSRDLLLRARKRIERRRLDGARVEIHQMHVTRELDRVGDLLRGVQTAAPPKLLITLALGILSRLRRALREDLRDRAQRDPNRPDGALLRAKSLACRVVDWIGSGDCTRRTWEPLERRVPD